VALTIKDVLCLTIVSHKNLNRPSDTMAKHAGTPATIIAITMTVKHGVTMVMIIMVVGWEVIVPMGTIMEMHIAKQYATHHVQRARHGVQTHTLTTDVIWEIGAHQKEWTAKQLRLLNQPFFV